MSKRIVWWLSGGNERCELCLHAYWYEIQRRCAACDRPLCPHCITTVRAESFVLCADCEPFEAEAS
ncbi:MAG: hypothetical protein ACRELD_04975 [Longimicrobiales bacterium]